VSVDVSHTIEVETERHEGSSLLTTPCVPAGHAQRHTGRVADASTLGMLPSGIRGLVQSSKWPRRSHRDSRGGSAAARRDSREKDGTGGPSADRRGSLIGMMWFSCRVPPRRPCRRSEREQ
jgi:hypothetical protein